MASKSFLFEVMMQKLISAPRALSMLLACAMLFAFPLSPAFANKPGCASQACEARLDLTGTQKRMAQRGLADAGHYDGAIDGDFGPATRAAIRAWQAARGEEATGYLSAAAWRELRDGRKARPKTPPTTSTDIDEYVKRARANLVEARCLLPTQDGVWRVSFTDSGVMYAQRYGFRNRGQWTMDRKSFCLSIEGRPRRCGKVASSESQWRRAASPDFDWCEALF